VFEQLLSELAKVLTAGKIPYMIIGGQAVLLYGEPRLTKDIDVTLGVDVDMVAAVKEAVLELGYNVLVDNVEAFVAETHVLPAGGTSGLRIDFIFSNSAYERQAIERARDIDIQGTRVSFAAPEDIVIHKIIAGRAVDIEDVRSIMIKNSAMDRIYIAKWLHDFDEALAADFLETFEKLDKETSA